MSNTVEVVSSQVAQRTVGAPPMPSQPELGVPFAAYALFRSAGIRMIAEPIAAAARLTGHARVLIASCRQGDGASSVAAALALDLAIRLGIDTVLVNAGSSGAASMIEAKSGGNGRPLRTYQTAAAHLWTAHCAPPAEAGRLTPANGERTDHDGLLEELRQVIARYRAAILDLGAVRLDARMLAAARPEDPVLVVARYGCSRRDELAATLSVIKVANRRLGGVIFNGSETPAIDRLRWLRGLGQEGR